MFSQFGTNFSLLSFKCHFIKCHNSDSVQKYVCKGTMKKIPGSSNVFTNDPELIRKICTLLSSSSHVSALIKLKKIFFSFQS